MNTKDYFDLYFSFESNAEFLWNIYFVFVLACTGWLLSIKQQPSTRLKILATLGYMVVASASLHALHSNYMMLSAVQIELQAVLKSESFKTHGIIHSIDKLPSPYFYLIFVVSLHAMGAILIMVALWSNSMWNAIRVRDVTKE